MKLLIILIMMLFSGLSLAEEFSVIVNKDSAATGISQKELVDLYTGAKTQFGGAKATLTMISISSPTGAAFLKAIGFEAAGPYEQAWTVKALSGGGQPPTQKASSDDIISTVSSSKGAIGIIPSSDIGKASSVKVLAIQ